MERKGDGEGSVATRGHLASVFKSDKTFSATKIGLHVESSSGVSKVPIVTSCVF
jgi:hypothetical protein